MTNLFVGFYGVYLLLVGMNGHASDLMDLIVRDLRGYVPWIASIIVIALLAQNDSTKKLVKPFIALLALNFVLMNYDTIKSQVQKIYFGV